MGLSLLQMDYERRRYESFNTDNLRLKALLVSAAYPLPLPDGPNDHCEVPHADSLPRTQAVRTQTPLTPPPSTSSRRESSEEGPRHAHLDKAIETAWKAKHGK